LKFSMKKNFIFLTKKINTMKKNYFIFSFILLITTLSAQAQVVNGNFENVKPNLLPSNWGMNFFQQVVIDPVTGQTSGDQIQYTWCFPSMCYSTTEAHTGQYAMEISNAFNQTQNTVIKGEAMIFNDPSQDIPGWNPGVPLEPGTIVQTLGFHYKFIPVGNDIAQAYINVFDQEGNEIGTATIDISGIHNQFEYVYSYINYTSNATPAYMYIGFSMAKDGTEPTFGSRLVIDDVITSFQALNLVTNPIETSTEFTIFPTLVDNEISIFPATAAVGNINYKVFNVEGKLVKETNVINEAAYVYAMNISELNSGMYFLQIESSLGKFTKKIIKK
jgi:hypothetical protein